MMALFYTDSNRMYHLAVSMLYVIKICFPVIPAHAVIVKVLFLVVYFLLCTLPCLVFLMKHHLHVEDIITSLSTKLISIYESFIFKTLTKVTHCLGEIQRDTNLCRLYTQTNFKLGCSRNQHIYLPRHW